MELIEMDYQDLVAYQKFFGDLIDELKDANDMSGEQELFERLGYYILSNIGNPTVKINSALIADVIWVKTAGVGNNMDDVDEKYYSMLDDVKKIGR